MVHCTFKDQKMEFSNKYIVQSLKVVLSSKYTVQTLMLHNAAFGSSMFTKVPSIQRVKDNYNNLDFHTNVNINVQPSMPVDIQLQKSNEVLTVILKIKTCTANS